MSRQSSYSANRNQLFYTLGNKEPKQKLEGTARMGGQTERQQEQQQQHHCRERKKQMDKRIVSQRWRFVTIARNNF